MFRLAHNMTGGWLVVQLLALASRVTSGGHRPGCEAPADAAGRPPGVVAPPPIGMYQQHVGPPPRVKRGALEAHRAGRASEHRFGAGREDYVFRYFLERRVVGDGDIRAVSGGHSVAAS